MDALALARATIEKTFTGRCDVIVYEGTRDPVSGITSKAERVLYNDIPCRLSYKFNNSHPSAPTDTAAQLDLAAKLFVSADTDIPAGSKIVVEQNGTAVAYKSSGQPMVYHSHREIMLELFKEWC